MKIMPINPIFLTPPTLIAAKKTSTRNQPQQKKFLAKLATKAASPNSRRISPDTIPQVADHGWTHAGGVQNATTTTACGHFVTAPATMMTLATEGATQGVAEEDATEDVGREVKRIMTITEI